MPRNISQEARTDIYNTQMQSVALWILDVDYGSGILRVVNNNKDIVFESNTYVATAFRFKPPVEEGSEVRGASVTIDAVDRNIIQIIRSIPQDTLVTVRMLFVNGAGANVEAGPWVFNCETASYNTNSATLNLQYGFRPQQLLSTVRYTAYDFPGIVYAQ